MTVHAEPVSPPTSAPAPGRVHIRRAVTAVALTPLGLLATLGVGLVLSGLLGLPILSTGDEYAPSAGQAWLLTGAMYVTALAAPVAAVVFAVMAMRAGHPKGKLVTVVTSLVLVLVAAAPTLSTWLGEAQLEREMSEFEATIPPDWYLPLGPIEQAPYRYTYADPEVERDADGLVVAVHMRWTTPLGPDAACADFRRSLEEFTGESVTEPTTGGQTCRISAGDGEFTAVVTPSDQGAGAVIVVTQRAPAGLR